jgi:4'-phosphopantetheinyl transferase
VTSATPVRVDLSYVDLASAAGLGDRLDALPPSERAAPPHAVITRVAVRLLLGRMLGIPPAELEITRVCEHCGHATHGRPRLAGTGRDAVAFSTSHSGTHAAIAVAAGVPAVGVDIEVVRTRRFLERLAARTLTPPALREWQQLPEADRLPCFLAAWANKEAYLKATGVGIATTLSAVPEQPAGWTVQSVDAPAGYTAAIAVEAPAVEVAPMEVAAVQWSPAGPAVNECGGTAS